MARLNDRYRIATFIEKLALRFYGKTRVVTTQTTKSEKL